MRSIYIGDGLKLCPSCQQRKPLNNFHKDSTSSTGLYTYCKSCKYKMYLLMCIKHRDRRNEYNKAYQKTWRANNKDKIKTLRNSWYIKTRKKVLEAYGGKCVNCGFTDWRALQIDHINGNGRKERSQTPNLSTYYSKLWIHREYNKYQILCANCNWIKRYENNENRRKTI